MHAIPSNQSTNASSLEPSLRTALALVLWTFLTGLGWTLGIQIAGIIGIQLSNLLMPVSSSGPNIMSQAISAVQGIAVGAIIGTLQWIVVRRLLAHSRLWIWHYLLAWIAAYMVRDCVGWTIFNVMPSSIDVDVVAGAVQFAAMGLVVGPCLGILQQLLLKDQFGLRQRWLWISMSAWSAPMLLYGAFIYLVFSPMPNHGFVAFAGGASGSRVMLLNAVGSVLYYGIGTIAGALTGYGAYQQIHRARLS